MYIDITNNLITTDLKIFESWNRCSLKDSFERMMKRYSLKNGDYENSILAEAFFLRLGWNNDYKDQIGTLWSIFQASAAYESLHNNWTYNSISHGICKQFLYTLDKNNSLEYWHWDVNRNWKKNHVSKTFIGRKFFDKNTIHSKKIEAIIGKYGRLNRISELTDSIANFMPCPGTPYNQLKGILPDVKDFFNLMIDKIQKCLDENKDLTYFYNNKSIVVDLKTLEDWHSWFVKNRERYCLSLFYSYDDTSGRLIGNPLFDGQSLDNVMPKTEKEIFTCINNFIDREETRAINIYKQF